MSEYRKLKTQYRSRNLLREALKACSVPFEEVKPGETERHLYGYRGKKRQETATFIVRRKHISPSSNDLGFHWNEQERCFEAIVSAYDTTQRDTTRIRKTVKKEYAIAYAMGQARAKGYRAQRVNGQNGEVQVVITGRL